MATQLPLTATICHSTKSKEGDSYFVGMSFKDLTQPDKLVLHYLTTTPQS